MAEEKKTVHITSTLPKDLSDRLKRYSEESGISIVRILRDAIKKELDGREEKKK